MGNSCQHPTPVPGRWDETDASSPFSAPGQRNLSTCPPAEGNPWLAWRGDVLSLLLYSSESLTSPIPHAAAVPTVNGTSSHGSKPPQKGHLFPTAPATDTLTSPHVTSGPWGRAQWLQPGCFPGHWWGARAEESRRGGGRNVENLKGALAFFSQNTLVPLQHHPQPSDPSGLQLSLLALLHLSQVVWQPPAGILSQIQVGGVGKGRA